MLHSAFWYRVVLRDTHRFSCQSNRPGLQSNSVCHRSVPRADSWDTPHQNESHITYFQSQAFENRDSKFSVQKMASVDGAVPSGGGMSYRRRMRALQRDWKQIGDLRI